MTRTWTVCRQPARVAMASGAGIRPTSSWCAGPSKATWPGRRRPPRRCLLRVAIYARVSTTRQAQAQTIEQQLDRLCAAVAERGWRPDEHHVYRDDGYSGARLGRPGLDRLRDQAALAELDLVVVTAPDRLARNYVHQVLLLDELGRHGLKVEFLDRPMSQDPHDQLLPGDPWGGRRVRAHADR
jgi:Resolvase, N terminal domain